MKKYMLIASAFILMLVMVSGCSEGQSAELQEVSTAVVPSGLLQIPYVIAKEKGFFEEEGLELHETVVSAGSDALSAVVGGGADVTVASSLDVKRLVEQDRDIKIFSKLFNHYGINVVISEAVAEEKGITPDSSVGEKIRALEGLNIGISAAGAGTDQLVRRLLESEGLNPDRDVVLIPVGSGQPQVVALSQKQTDAFLNSSPIADMATLEGGMLLFDLSKGEIEEFSGIPYGIAARQVDLDEDPEKYQKFVNAIVKGAEFAETNREETKEILARELDGIDPDIIDMAFDNNYEAIAKNPIITEEEFNNVNLFDGTDVDFESVIYNKFAEEAMK